LTSALAGGRSGPEDCRARLDDAGARRTRAPANADGRPTFRFLRKISALWSFLAVDEGENGAQEGLVFPL
jgi:hypothetical protein